MACRVKKAREWTHRLMLEAALHEENCFLTLTYDDEHLPDDNSLKPRHLQLFLKRLRFSMEPKRFRYFAVGEYGDQSQRPHYHLALFGVRTCEYGLTRSRLRRECCDRCTEMSRLWPQGYCFLGRCETQSARYIAGYVIKKLTQANHPDLCGRHPEFARMSNRPGIGCGMADEIASTLLEHGLDSLPDVPATLAHGRARWPLGKYLRRQIRKRIGRDEKAPPSTLEKLKEKLSPMHQIGQACPIPGFKEFAFKGAIIDAGKGGRQNMEAKLRRQQKRGSI